MASETRLQTQMSKTDSGKSPWTTPQVEDLSVEEIVDLAEIKVAFANTNSCADAI